MKKLFKGILIGGILIIGLSSCNTKEPVEDKAQGPAIEEPIQEDTKETAPEPEAIKTPKVKAPIKTPEVDRTKEDETEYALFIADNSSYIGQSLTELGGLFDNPTINEEWLLKVAIQTVTIESTAQEIIDRPNVPDKFKDAHATIVEAMERYIVSMEFMTQAIDNNFDENLLNQSIANMNKANELVQIATDQMIKLK